MKLLDFSFFCAVFFLNAFPAFDKTAAKLYNIFDLIIAKTRIYHIIFKTKLLFR